MSAKRLFAGGFAIAAFARNAIAAILDRGCYMSIDCEGWAKDGRKLPGLLVSGFDVANVLQMYRLAEPQALVIRLTISDMGENKPMPVHTPELGL